MSGACSSARPQTTRAFGGASAARTYYIADITGQALLHVLYEQLMKHHEQIDRYEEHPDWIEATLEQIIENASRVTAVEHSKAMLQRTVMYEHAHRFFQTYDLLLAPVTPTAAPPVDTLYNSDAFPRWTKGAPYTLPFNLTGAPAASMPAGLNQAGLPVGLQIVGPPRADHADSPTAAANGPA